MNPTREKTTKLSIRIREDLWEEAKRVLTPPGHSKLGYGVARVLVERAIEELIQLKKAQAVKAQQMLDQVMEGVSDGNKP